MLMAVSPARAGFQRHHLHRFLQRQHTLTEARHSAMRGRLSTARTARRHLLEGLRRLHQPPQRQRALQEARRADQDREDRRQRDIAEENAISRASPTDWSFQASAMVRTPVVRRPRSATSARASAIARRSRGAATRS
jgi:hypothetical protein